MSIKVGALGDKRLFEDLLLPSWFSGFAAVTIGVLLVAGTIVLTVFGDTVQQSLLGLQHVYTQSSVGAKVSTISDNFASNTYLNNVLLFLLWGSVGLMVYSVVQGIVSELSRANSLVQELRFAQVDRRSILREALLRETVKVLAFVTWWVIFRYAIFKLTPFTIATAHTSATHLANVADWGYSLLAIVLCVLTVHVLTVLMRLSFLRARVFGTEIEP